MPRLFASYDIELDAPIIIKRRDESDLIYDAELPPFTVGIKLQQLRFVMKRANETHKVYFSHKLQLCVSRFEEHIETDPNTPSADKRPKLSEDFYRNIRDVYNEQAQKIARRILLFFTYKLWQPQHRFELINSNQFQNPDWEDEHNVKYSVPFAHLILQQAPGTKADEFSTTDFEKRHDRSLVKALETPITPPLHDELFYDAQSAIFNRNYRRAVLEMDIAVETMVKNKFFGQRNASALAFQYLEDRGRVNVRVLDMISTMADAVFNSNFQRVDCASYTQIDYLFRCRNKIAHRGELIYNDIHGSRQTVTRPTLVEWWASCSELHKWLRSVSA